MDDVGAGDKSGRAKRHAKWCMAKDCPEGAMKEMRERIEQPGCSLNSMPALASTLPEYTCKTWHVCIFRKRAADHPPC